MPCRLIQVDAFASRPFGGNPAAVCLLAEAASAQWMQLVAREMNLSETAFVHPSGEHFALRWFTPAAEVDLCGHATLATAHVLWEEGILSPDQTASFSTKSGILSASKKDDWIEMDFPAKPVTPSQENVDWIAAIGVTPRFVGKNNLDFFVEIDSEQTLVNLKPNFGVISRLPARALIVTARSSGQYDFVSRFFAPAVGVPEDPVTGSAHCALAPYWAAKIGRNDLTGYQASVRRGEVRVRLVGDRVILVGQAVTNFRTELLA